MMTDLRNSDTNAYVRRSKIENKIFILHLQIKIGVRDECLESNDDDC